jgi:hypothetical protein
MEPNRRRPLFAPAPAIASRFLELPSAPPSVPVSPGSNASSIYTDEFNDPQIAPQCPPDERHPGSEQERAPDPRPTVTSPEEEIIQKSSILNALLTSSFIRQHPPLQTPQPKANLSRLSVPLSNPLYLTPDRSDGLTPSTQRLAINTGHPVPQTSESLFGPNAPPVALPRLAEFLSHLTPPRFTPWSDVLAPPEIAEYQRLNHRKFPIFHRLREGVSISELKSNVTQRVFIPGLENDLWRFVVDVCILTAGSPYGKDLSVDVFRKFTQFVVSVVVRDETWVARVLDFTGGGSLAMVVSFLVVLLVLFKCRKTVLRNRRRRQRIVVLPATRLFAHLRLLKGIVSPPTPQRREWAIFSLYSFSPSSTFPSQSSQSIP